MLSWLEKNGWFSWTVTLLIAILIFYVSSLSFSGGSFGKSIYSILYHFGVFFVLGFFLILSLVKGRRTKMAFVGLLIGILYGFSDEAHQLYVPGRFASLFDVFVDSVGILFAMMIYLMSLSFRKNHEGIPSS